MKSVMAKKSLLMCRCTRKRKYIPAHDVLDDDDERAKIVMKGIIYLKIYVIPLPT